VSIHGCDAKGVRAAAANPVITRIKPHLYWRGVLSFCLDGPHRAPRQVARKYYALAAKTLFCHYSQAPFQGTGIDAILLLGQDGPMVNSIRPMVQPRDMPKSSAW
jgi:hypothetical protein